MNEDTKKKVNERYQRELSKGEFFWPDSIFKDAIVSLGIFVLLLLLATIGMGFTGYLLPWNQRAYWATTVGTQIAGSVPFLGDFILKALRGGPDLSALTLQRFFSAHIWMLPAALAGLIGVHLYLIIKHGESHFPTRED